LYVAEKMGENRERERKRTEKERKRTEKERERDREKNTTSKKGGKRGSSGEVEHLLLI